MGSSRSVRLSIRSLGIVAVCLGALLTGSCGASEDSAGGGGSGSGGSGDKLAKLPDGFPDKPITLWNTFEPGHTDDLLNKAFAEAARKYSPVSVVTDTRPAPGPVSWYGHVDFLKNRPQAAEGYDLYAISWAGATVRPWTVEQLADASLDALNPVGVVEQAPFVFVVPTKGPYKTMADVEAAAKAEPGKLRAVAGETGSLINSTLAVWEAAAGLGKQDIRFIPTGGSGESLSLLRGGGADLGVLTFTAGIQDQMRVLAVSGEKEFGGLPGVPVAEAGGVPIPVGSERGYGALESVSKEHLDWLYQLIQKVAADKQFQDRQKGFDFVVRDAAWVKQYQQQIVRTVVPILEERGLTTGKRQ
jgi:tripartite-type tricarboxylate transporter receptor subunit TctC